MWVDRIAFFVAIPHPYLYKSIGDYPDASSIPWVIPDKGVMTIYLFSLLKLQSLRRLVANLRRTEILDRTRIYIAGCQRPLLAMCCERLERRTIQLHQSLLDNRLHLAMTTLHVHHHRYGDTTCDPLISRSCRVANRRHITRLTCCDQARSGVTQ